jgi:pantoate--beta-alanine ligase
MEIIKTPAAMQCRAETVRRAGKKISFVPTMGFLHEGHLSLMREGRRRAEVLVASIFVNPTQFGPNEDFGRYPRAFERDCELMNEVPVDIVYAPEPEAMYSEDAETWVEAVEITKGLCGAHRPGHFRGVTTVVAKLFNIVKPHYAMFGEKDFQQLRAIQRMVTDLNFDLEIVSMPTVREADGMAMSSRNAYLTADERERALSLSRALSAARETFGAGSRDPRDLVRAACAVLSDTSGVRIEYIEAVDAETLRPISRVERPVVVAIAAQVGKTRLIDNAVFSPALP